MMTESTSWWYPFHIRFLKADLLAGIGDNGLQTAVNRRAIHGSRALVACTGRRDAQGIPV